MPHRQQVRTYFRVKKPFVFVAGPPCTAFGPWSHLNEAHGSLLWQRNWEIGVTIANFVAELAMFQLQGRRHFVVENPLASRLLGISFMAHAA